MYVSSGIRPLIQLFNHPFLTQARDSLMRAVSHDDLAIHHGGKCLVAFCGRVLIPQSHLHITMAATVQEFSERCALLRVNGQSSVAQVVELEPRYPC